MLDFLNMNGIAIQAISAIVLALITAFYAYETHKSVKVFSEQRKDNILPMLSIEKMVLPNKNELSKSDNYCVECTLKNLGNGPALRIVMGFVGGAKGNSESVSQHFIDFIDKQVSQQIHIHIPREDFDTVTGKTKTNLVKYTIKAIIDFEDSYGDTYEIEQSLATEKFYDVWGPVLGSYVFSRVKSPSYMTQIYEEAKDKIKKIIVKQN